jgi:hypothetical protein
MINKCGLYKRHHRPRPGYFDNSIYFSPEEVYEFKEAAITLERLYYNAQFDPRTKLGRKRINLNLNLNLN